MRSQYPHLPNPKMFVPAEHKKPTYWQSIVRDPEFPAALLAMTIFVIGFAISASP